MKTKHPNVNQGKQKSIRRKLMTAMLVTSGLSLFVAGLAFVVFDVLSFRRATVDNLSTVARVVAENITAALAFVDHEAANNTLKGLRGEPHIVSATVLTHTGHVFAQYMASGAGHLSVASEQQQTWLGLFSSVSVGSEGYSFGGGGVDVYREVRHRGDLLGYVVIRGNLAALWTRLYWSVMVLGGVLALAWGVAYLLAGRFRRDISEPIIALEQAMLDFSRNQNDRAFITGRADDEVGRLIQGFNAMVKEIRSRDQRLITAMDGLRLARDAAEAANQAKLRYIATLSHEMRGPMTGVVAMTDLLLTSQLNATQADSAGIIKRSAENLLDFVSNVLDYAKIESGRMTLEVIEFDLDEVVGSVVETMAGPVQSRGLTLTPFIDQDVPRRLKGDPVRLRQVLLNLISNAVKFTSVGSVTVRVQKRYTDCTRRDQNDPLVPTSIASIQPVSRNTPIEYNDIEFHITDTGIGITAEAQKRLFEPFEQADMSTTRRFGGSGLGLAIVKELVELMGGVIEVKSRPGVGSIFSFYTPFGLPSRACADPPTTGIKPMSRPVRLNTPLSATRVSWGGAAARKILLAEDNVLTQEVTSRVLRSFSCEVDVVSDGVGAVSAVKACRYDLAILDWYMPVMDGVTAAKAIRDSEVQRKLNYRLPIVLTTASSLPSSQVSLAAVDDYLAKPYRLEDMARLLHRWCHSNGLKSHSDSEAWLAGYGEVKASSDGERALLNATDGPVLLDASVLGWFESIQLSTYHDSHESTARLDRIINLFLSQSQAILTDLAYACERQDGEVLFRASHSLKNLAANVGARALYQLCITLECDTKAVNWQAVEKNRLQIVTCHKSTCTRLVEYKGIGYGRFSENRGAA